MRYVINGKLILIIVVEDTVEEEKRHRRSDMKRLTMVDDIERGGYKTSKADQRH